MHSNTIIQFPISNILFSIPKFYILYSLAFKIKFWIQSSGYKNFQLKIICKFSIFHFAITSIRIFITPFPHLYTYIVLNDTIYVLTHKLLAIVACRKLKQSFSIAENDLSSSNVVSVYVGVSIVRIVTNIFVVSN